MRSIVQALGAIGLLVIAFQQAVHSAERPLLVPGDAMPSRLHGPSPWQGPDYFLINRAGQIASFGRAGFDNDISSFEGIWFLDADHASWSLVTEDGGVVPNLTPQDVFDHDDDDTRVDLSLRGDVIFATRVNGPSNFIEGTWRWHSGTEPELLTFDGPAPGFPQGERLNDPDYCCDNLRGEYGINSDVSPSGIVASWLVSPEGDYTEVARSGMPAPGVPDATLEFPHMTQLNSSGQFTLMGNTRPVDGDLVGRDVSLWFAPQGSTGALTPVLIAGQSAPGSNRERFLNVVDVRLNDAGRVAIVAQTAESERLGVWSYEPTSGLEPVVLSGVPVPSRPGLEFDYLISEIDLAENGEVIFVGVEGTRSGVWKAGLDGVITPLARSGDLAPGTDLRFDAAYSPTTNRRGIVAFEARLAGANGTDEGIWGIDGSGKMHLIAREVLGDLGIRGVDDVGRVYFQRDGDLFVSDVLVPEPPSHVLFAALILSFLHLRRAHGGIRASNPRNQCLPISCQDIPLK